MTDDIEERAVLARRGIDWIIRIARTAWRTGRS